MNKLIIEKFVFEDEPYFEEKPNVEIIEAALLPTSKEDSIFRGSIELCKTAKLNGYRVFHTDDFFVPSRLAALHPNIFLNTDLEIGTLSSFLGRKNVFIKPNNCLKYFSGRFVKEVSLNSVDFGFYFENQNVEVVISSKKEIKNESRFLIYKKQIVDCCFKSVGIWYTDAPQIVQKFIDEINCPDDLYIVDVAEYNKELKIVELNPFSSSDLYCMNPDKVLSIIQLIQ